MAPWTVPCQAPLSIKFSKQKSWSQLPFPTPRDLPYPGIEPTSLASPALAGGFFTNALPEKPMRGKKNLYTHTQSPVQSLSHVRLFVTPLTAAHQASLSITNYWSLLKLMSIESVMSSNHLIFCHPLLLLPSIFPSIRVFSSESVNGVSASASVLPMIIQD